MIMRKTTAFEIGTGIQDQQTMLLSRGYISDADSLLRETCYHIYQGNSFCYCVSTPM